MKPFKIIPAIDLMDGKCVRLTQGNYANQTVYPRDPVALAESFLEHGLDRVHVVDLDGAREGTPVNLDTVGAIAGTGIHVELGGGLRNGDDMARAIDNGVQDLILGSRLLSDRQELDRWLSDFPGKLIAGIDVRKGTVAVHGWRSTTSISALDLLEKINELAFLRIIVTDISRDGMLKGPNIPFFEMISSVTSKPIIASGGIRSMKDIEELKILLPRGIEGVIVGKAIYEGYLTLEEIETC